jgi:hypothetical protein
MKNDVVPVEIRGILPANSGCAIFVGNDEKIFVIQVEHNMGAVIGMFLRDTPKERPLTHDLIATVFKGFNITVPLPAWRRGPFFALVAIQPGWGACASPASPKQSVFNLLSDINWLTYQQ